MKKLLKPLFALVLLTGILNNSVMAQTAPNETTTSRDVDDHDNSGRWGLLGLVGLLGLLGMKKNDRTGTYSSTGTPQNR